MRVQKSTFDGIADSKMESLLDLGQYCDSPVESKINYNQLKLATILSFSELM